MKFKRSELESIIKEEIKHIIAEQETGPGTYASAPRGTGDPGEGGELPAGGEFETSEETKKSGYPFVQRLKKERTSLDGFVVRGSNLYKSQAKMIDDLRKAGMNIPLMSSEPLIYAQAPSGAGAVMGKEMVQDPARVYYRSPYTAPKEIPGAWRLESDKEALKRIGRGVRQYGARYPQLVDLFKEWRAAKKEDDAKSAKKAKKIKAQIDKLIASANPAQAGTKEIVDPYSGAPLWVYTGKNEDWSVGGVISNMLLGVEQFGMMGDEDDIINNTELGVAVKPEDVHKNFLMAPLGYDLKIDTEGRIYQEVLGHRASRASREPGGFYSLDRNLPENQLPYWTELPWARKYVKAIVERDVYKEDNVLKEKTTTVWYYIDLESKDKIHRRLRASYKRRKRNKEVTESQIATAWLNGADGVGFNDPQMHPHSRRQFQDLYDSMEYFLQLLKHYSPRFFAEILPDGMPESMKDFERRWRGDYNLQARIFVYALPKVISAAATAVSAGTGTIVTSVAGRGVELTGHGVQKLVWLLDWYSSLPKNINPFAPYPKENIKVLKVIRIHAPRAAGSNKTPRRGVTFVDDTGPLTKPLRTMVPDELHHIPGLKQKMIDLPAIEGDIVICEYGLHDPKTVEGGRGRQRIAMFRQRLPDGTYQWSEIGPVIEKGYNIVGDFLENIIPGRDLSQVKSNIKLAPRLEIPKNQAFAHRPYWSRLGAALLSLGNIQNGWPDYGLPDAEIINYDVLDLDTARDINGHLKLVESQKVPGTKQESLFAKGRRYIDPHNRLDPDGLFVKTMRKLFGRKGERFVLSGRRPVGIRGELWDKIKGMLFLGLRPGLGQRPMSTIVGSVAASPGAGPLDDAGKLAGTVGEAYLDVHISSGDREQLIKLLQQEIRNLELANARHPDIPRIKDVIEDIRKMKNIDQMVHEEITLLGQYLFEDFDDLLKGKTPEEIAAFRAANLTEDDARALIRRLGGGAGADQVDIPEKTYVKIYKVLMLNGVPAQDRNRIIQLLRGTVEAAQVGSIRETQKMGQALLNQLQKVSGALAGGSGKAYGVGATIGAPVLKGIGKGLWLLGWFGVGIDFKRSQELEVPMNPVKGLAIAMLGNLVDPTGIVSASYFDEYRTPDTPHCRSRMTYKSILAQFTNNFKDMKGISSPGVSHAINTPPPPGCFNWQPFSLSELDIPIYEALDLPPEELEKRRALPDWAPSANPMKHPEVEKSRANPRKKHELIYNKLIQMKRGPEFDKEQSGWEALWMSEDAKGMSLYQAARREYYIQRFGPPIDQEEYEKIGKIKWSRNYPNLHPDEFWQTTITKWWRRLMIEQVAQLIEDKEINPEPGSPDWIEITELMAKQEASGPDVDNNILAFRSYRNSLLLTYLKEGGSPGDPWGSGGNKARLAKIAFKELKIRADYPRLPAGYHSDIVTNRVKSLGDFSSVEEESRDAKKILKDYSYEYITKPNKERIKSLAKAPADIIGRLKDESDIAKQLIILNRMRKSQFKTQPVLFFIPNKDWGVGQAINYLSIQEKTPDGRFEHNSVDGQIVGGGKVDFSTLRKHLERENKPIDLPGEKKAAGELTKLTAGRVVFIPVEDGTDYESIYHKQDDPVETAPEESESPGTLQEPAWKKYLRKTKAKKPKSKPKFWDPFQ